MMFMTAKVDIKKTLIALAAAVGLIIGMIFLFGGNDAAPTAATGMSGTAARVQCLKNLSELNTKERKIESVYDLRKQNQTETKNKPIYCLTYEFMLSDKNIVFCVILGILPNVMLRYIKNTSFTLNVDAQRRKIVPKDSFTGKIFINSDNSNFQSLKFIFQVEEQQLNDFYGFFKGIETRSETEIIISYLKTFLYQY